MAKMEIKFTKKALDSLPLPADASTRIEAYDTDRSAAGLMIRVTHTGAKSFYVYRRVQGVPKRIKLGAYPDMTIEQAQKKARNAVTQVSDDLDPVAMKRDAAKARKTKGVTLHEVLTAYLKARKKLKPRTISDYHACVRESFSDWKDKPLIYITEDMVKQRHTARTKASKARADNAFRVLRALFNYAMFEYKNEKKERIFKENPVDVLSHVEAWNQVARRKTLLRAHEIKPWFDAVMNLTSKRSGGVADVVRDFLLLLIFTGLRRTEASKLRRDQVSLQARTLTITDTKNSETHTLPLPDYVFDLLKRRMESGASEYVFAGHGGYITKPDDCIREVSKAIGIHITPHDLRRTFATIAESLDLSSYAIKRLINHKMKHDVTAGYIVADVERLREPMTRIQDFILKAAGVKPSADVVSSNKASG